MIYRNIIPRLLIEGAISMSVYRQNEYLLSVVRELCSLPTETEWVEFKHNNKDPDQIGEYISALANSAALLGKANAYIIWGVDDQSHEVIGTSFSPSLEKVGNEELENWLLRLLKPKINFRFYEVSIQERRAVLLEIGMAFLYPVSFRGNEFIRVGSYKKRLKDFPEKERDLWHIFNHTPFEREIAMKNIDSETVLSILDYPAYFDLMALPLPEGRKGILDSLEKDELIVCNDSGKLDITNLGAILFAKRLSDFRHLKRQVIRVITYKDNSKIETNREKQFNKGYASSFNEIIDFIISILPANEIIEKALRKEVSMFPEIAIRELVANAIIHQDFNATGTSICVEIFENRMEITNPGLPLVEIDRFLDSPPKSRNEALASFMRRIGICEERGSGIDKVVFQTELYQLPAPIFETTKEHTRIVLFSHRNFNDMDKADRIRACYLHACLKYVQRDFMTNTTLRNRFGIENKNSAIVSRIIKDTLEANLIKCHDETVGNKARKYLPCWVD